MPRLVSLAAAIVLCLSSATAAGQALDVSNPAVSSAVPREQEATLTYANRPIAVLRARVLTRMPAERAAAAKQTLEQLVARGVFGPVRVSAAGGAQMITVGGEAVFAVLPADVDPLTQDSLTTTAQAVAGRLSVALAEVGELRTPRTLLRGAVISVAVTALFVLLFWLLLRGGHLAGQRLTRITERRLAESKHGRALRVTRLPRLAGLLVNLAVTIAASFLAYVWLSFVFRQFPYTRPWGESLRSVLIGQILEGAATIAAALPGLLIVAVIVVVARALTKAIVVIFNAVEQGRMTIPGVYADTSVATRRLVVALLWLLAAAMAYPHIPGSESSAFKGLSLFVGVVLSLGSSGVMQHIMSGLMLTFSRAVHAGDFARIGDVTGTVLQTGMLATKIRTPYGEEITIPNAVVVAQTITNYSQASGVTVPFLTTSVTIGYDTPWRQVEALLLTAAQETPGVRTEPVPFVWREALEDFYVKYTLLVAPANPCHRAVLLDALHVRILDAFNRYGVQIMSPHYLADPDRPKVVPASHWHEPPAERPVMLAPTNLVENAAGRS